MPAIAYRDFKSHLCQKGRIRLPPSTPVAPTTKHVSKGHPPNRYRKPGNPAANPKAQQSRTAAARPTPTAILAIKTHKNKVYRKSDTARKYRAESRILFGIAQFMEQAYPKSRPFSRHKRLGIGAPYHSQMTPQLNTCATAEMTLYEKNMNPPIHYSRKNARGSHNRYN